MDSIFRTYVIYDGPMKPSFDHHNAPLLVADLFLNPNPIPHSQSSVVATSLLSVPISAKGEIHLLSLAHTLVKSSFTERGTVFLEVPAEFLIKSA
jgi:hypothetical protein